MHDLDRLQHPEMQARHGERAQAGLVQQDHERRRAAVEDRDLGAVDLDEHVVDTEGQERRQEVLDRADREAVAQQRRRVVLRADVREGGGDGDAHVRADEADAVLGRRGPQAQPHRTPRVKPDARAPDVAPQCSSVSHDVSASRARTHTPTLDDSKGSARVGRGRRDLLSTT